LPETFSLFLTILTLQPISLGPCSFLWYILYQQNCFYQRFSDLITDSYTSNNCLASPLSIYLNIKMGIQMFVCHSVCWYVEGLWKSKPLPQSWLNFVCTPPPVQGRFWCKFDPRCLPLGLGGGLQILKVEGPKYVRSAGCKLTRVGPGTSASLYNNFHSFFFLLEVTPKLRNNLDFFL